VKTQSVKLLTYLVFNGIFSTAAYIMPQQYEIYHVGLGDKTYTS